MKTMLMVLFMSAAAAVAAQESTCVACHTDMGGDYAAAVAQWKGSIHGAAGISCDACHGGDPRASEQDAAMNPKKGFKGKPSRLDTPKFCGTCHADKAFIKKFNPNLPTDQLESYKTSLHGQAVAKGDARPAVCTDCHGVHNILKKDNPLSSIYPTRVVDTCAKCHGDKALMASYKIPGTEVEEYRHGVHAKALYDKNDLSAPTCPVCHGAHGASPPGVASVAFVCGTCHALNQELFAKSPHAGPWSAMGFSQCAECHGKHLIAPATEEMLNPRGKAVCLRCHDKGDKGYAAMTAFYAGITGLSREAEAVDTRVKEADRMGMLMEDAHLLLQDAHTSYIQARTAIHSFHAGAVDKVLGAGRENTAKAGVMADAAFTELRYRRKGLAVFTFFALVFAVLLALKIRQIAADRKSAAV